jgi:hypothetical protein
MLHKVPFPQIGGDIAITEQPQCRTPAVVEPFRRAPPGGFCRGGIDAAQVTGKPVLVQPSFPADRRRAGAITGPGDDEFPDVRVAVPPCHVGRHGNKPGSARSLLARGGLLSSSRFVMSTPGSSLDVARSLGY